MSTMWIEYIAPVPDHKVGEQVAVQKGGEAAAQNLIDIKLAKKIDDPTAEGQTIVELKALVKDEITGVMKDVVKEMRAEAKARSPHITVHDNADDDPTFGFKHIGEQFRAIKGFYGSGGTTNDDRLKRIMAKAPTTYANEGTGADGGFLLAPNFSNQILAWTFDDDALFSRTDTYTTGSNSLTVPKDETTPWGTSGVQVYWTGEANQLTQSKPKFGQDNLILHKLTALVPVTDEQLQDSFTGLGPYVGKQAGERIRFAVDEAIVNGNGVGKPLGIINSGAIVQQAAESAQTAATINITNIAKMISRIPSASMQSLVWLVHPAAFPQLVILTNGNNSLYIGPGQVEDKKARLGRLLGIPLIISQHCQTIGTPGDIFLFDLSKYITLTKGDGIQTAMSIHLFFDYNVSTFRFNFRVAGQPWMQAPITSQYGSYTMSPFVDLASR